MKKHIEIKTVEHKGVQVTLKIDYDLGTASIVEFGGNQATREYRTKAWHFGGRGLEYMNGWINIFEAMTVAVKEAKKDLEWKLAEDSKFKGEMMAVVVDKVLAAQKHIKKAKKKK